MVLGIFKSKEQRNKDKLKKELKGKISAIGQGGGRSKQGTKKRYQRELANVDKPKKKVQKKVNKGNNSSALNLNKNISKSKPVTKTKSGKKLSPYEMKQAERKAAMQKRAGEKHRDFQKMRKGTISKEAFIKKYPRSNTAKKYGKK